LEARPSGDFIECRKIETHTPIAKDKACGSRISDRHANVMSYWKTQSPQAHHIVEFNNLEAVGASTRDGSGDLDYLQLPCVLMMRSFISGMLAQN